jgi:putative ABC transport system permease protein
MPSLRTLLSRALELVLRGRRDARLTEEIQAHLQHLTDEYVAAGMSPAEARRAARRAFGGVEQVKAAYRDQRGWPGFDAFGQDLRFAVRLLVKDRRFTIAASLALGLGMAVNNSVFAIINTALLRDLPFDEPDRLVRLTTLNARGNQSGVSYPDFLDWRQSLASLSGVAASTDGPVNLSDDRHPAERLRGSFASAETFDVLGRQPIVGRGFRAEDELPGATPVVILGYRLWATRYLSDPSIVGQTIRINETPTTVVGVMPDGFKFPLIAQIWQPLTQAPGVTRSTRDTRRLSIVGRLAGGATLEQARAELNAIAATLAQAHPKTNANVTTAIQWLRDGTGGRALTSILLTLMGMVAIVLLIACFNVASLLLARSVTRSREIAIRAAVGASRSRIVRQLLIECVLLASVAAVISMMLSTYGARLLATGFAIHEPGLALEDTAPYWVDLTRNGAAYAFIGFTCLVASLAFGLLPALQIARTDVNALLKEGGRAGTSSSRRRWTGGFIVAQLVLTLVLLTGAGLIWRSFLSHYHADFGIDTRDIVTMRVTASGPEYAGDEQKRVFLARLEERLGTAHGLRSAAITTAVPFIAPGDERPIVIDGRPPSSGAEPPTVWSVAVGRQFFETLKLPVVRGRALTETDSQTGQPGAVINERLAGLFFGDRDPIGQRIRLEGSTAAAPSSPWFTIVGVAKTLPGIVGDNAPNPVVYVPVPNERPAPSTISVIASGETVAVVAGAVRDQVRALDPDVPVYAIEPLDTWVARGRSGQRLLGTWFAILAAIALVLASVGLYALTSHSVAERTREIGVRLALGASRSRVRWLFLRRTVVHLALALTIGLGLALNIGKLFQMFLRQVSPRDVVTVTSVIIGLVLVSVAASLLAVRRATRVDPIVALRSE